MDQRSDFDASNPRVTMAGSWQARAAVAQASYYRRRADAHGMLAERALPVAVAIHRALADAYRSAALSTERGEAVDFTGDHRAERSSSPLAEPTRLATE